MKKIQLLGLLASVIAVLLATAGLTYAWFTQNAALTTLLDIQPPDSIKIIPISEEIKELTELDLDFQKAKGDYKDEETGMIHIFRPVSIKTTSPVHQLEIVHTTNLSNLTFHIYPAEIVGENRIQKGTPAISGEYKNLKNSDSKLAKKEKLDNYKDEADVADNHAYPLYWLANKTDKYSVTKNEFDPTSQENKDFYYTYYYLEISWLETTKETDLFYIMARNIDAE